MNRWLVPLAAGLLFGVGLVVSGMTQPAKVVGFLDVAGAWDPSLALVMIGAIGVHFAAYRWVPRMTSPVFGVAFSLPTKRDLDGRLVAGAMLFGVGWGLGGFCPGPGLVASAAGSVHAVAFVGAMLAGMALFRVVERATRSTEVARPTPAPVRDA